jgi:hypothetical protein
MIPHLALFVSVPQEIQKLHHLLLTLLRIAGVLFGASMAQDRRKATPLRIALGDEVTVLARAPDTVARLQLGAAGTSAAAAAAAVVDVVVPGGGDGMTPPAGAVVAPTAAAAPSAASSAPAAVKAPLPGVPVAAVCKRDTRLFGCALVTGSVVLGASLLVAYLLAGSGIALA